MKSVEMELVKCDLCGSDKTRPHVEVEGNAFVECPECGFIYLNPRPTASQGEVCDESVECLTEKGYRESRAWYYKRILSEFEPFRKTGRLLEVGCASGGFLSAARDAGWETVGVEISAKLAGIGQERGLDIQTCDICDAELPAGSFDVAVLNMVIEHVPSPRKVALLIRNVLRPGGALWMHTPNYASTSIKMARDGYNYPGAHLSCFTPATLKKLCTDTGFSVKYLKATGFRFPGGRKSWRKPLARFLGFFITLLGKGHRLKVMAVKKAGETI